jgi:membrane-bound metal-dependent hydrolase YbcI (DUF457 family)
LASKEENTSFAVGHMALAYIIAKPTAKLLKTNLIIPLVMVLSVLPDIDLIVPAFHRGPSHSVVTALIAFLPVFVLYAEKAVPYFLALVSHSLIGDFLIGGHVQLLWPLSRDFYNNNFLNIKITDSANIALELILFVVATAIMFKTKDLFSFFQAKRSNLILMIPLFTVLLPTFAAYPLQVPLLLVVPHLFYLVLFSIAVVMEILRITRKDRMPLSNKGSNPTKIN